MSGCERENRKEQNYHVFVWTLPPAAIIQRGPWQWLCAMSPMATVVTVGYPLLVRRWRDQICRSSSCLCYCFRPFGWWWQRSRCCLSWWSWWSCTRMYRTLRPMPGGFLFGSSEISPDCHCFNLRGLLTLFVALTLAQIDIIIKHFNMILCYHLMSYSTFAYIRLIYTFTKATYLLT